MNSFDHRRDQIAEIRARAARLERVCADLATEVVRLTQDVVAVAEQPTERPVLVGVEEAATMIRVSRSTMFSLVREERVASVRVGSRRLVPVADLERFASGTLRHLDVHPAVS